jgi:type 1 glutamine amidotransferase
MKKQFAFGIVVALGFAVSAHAQDWARMRTGAERTVFFKAALPPPDTRGTLVDSLESLRPIRFANIEGFSTQKIGGEISKTLGPDLTAGELATVKDALRKSGRRMVAYSVPAISGAEPDARKLFQFARELGVETILSAADPAALPLVDKLAGEFQVKLALAAPSRPRELRATLDKLSNHIGALVDLAAWQKAGIQPLEGVTALGGRIMAVRLPDPGVPNELLMAIYRQKARPVIYSFQPPTSPDPVSGLSAALDAYERALTPVMTAYVNELGRTTAIRTLESHSRLSPAQNSEARQKMDAAMPAEAQARPRKARKLLVIDLQVGYPGHPSIPYANYVLEQFAKKTGAWEPAFSNDLSNFRYEKLRQYDAIFLNNTVGLLFPDPEVRASILRFLREGGGLIGYHAATHASIDWPEFTEVIGASSGAHREATEKVTVKLDDPTSPINAPFGGEEFVSIDEHFRWNNYSRQRVRVLLSIDVPKTDMNQGRGCDICTRADNDNAISWVRSYGKGRVFYTSLGHGPAAFMNPKFLGHILAGVQFALGDLDANTTPGNQPPAR